MATARRLARNVVYNLVGQVAPLAVAVVAIPLLIRGLGADRFGILTLAWTAIGYFGLFDLGIGRALTQALSAAIGADRHEETGPLTWTAMWMMLGLGSAGAVLIAAGAPWFVSGPLRIAPSLQRETVTAIRILAISLPFVATTAGLRGVLEAYQEFGIATALRLPYATFTFLGPVFVLPWSNRLPYLVGVLVLARLVLWAAHLVVVLRRYPAMRHHLAGDRGCVRPLLRTGGWMTVSNVVSPLMVNVDRFFIAGLISTAAVAYYVTPYEVATKLLLVPGAMLGVLFPAFASSFVTEPRATAHRMYQGERVLLVVMFPLVLALTALAPEGLRLWVGETFAREGAPVMRWLAAGVLINSIAQVAFGVLQGIGRSDLTAALHLVELPIYIALLWVLARTFGVAGVAMAWTFRIALDTVVLLVLARRALRVAAAPPDLTVPVVLVVLLAALGIVALIPAFGLRLAVGGVIAAGFAAFAWLRLLRPSERGMLLAFVRSPRSRPAS